MNAGHPMEGWWASHAAPQHVDVHPAPGTPWEG